MFFTHFHSDHTVGFADFWLTSWIPAGGARTSPLTVTGPPGVEALVEGHRIAFADDIKIRMVDQKVLTSSLGRSQKRRLTEDGLTVTSLTATMAKQSVQIGVIKSNMKVSVLSSVGMSITTLPLA